MSVNRDGNGVVSARSCGSLVAGGSCSSCYGSHDERGGLRTHAGAATIGQQLVQAGCGSWMMVVVVGYRRSSCCSCRDDNGVGGAAVSGSCRIDSSSWAGSSSCCDAITARSRVLVGKTVDGFILVASGRIVLRRGRVGVWLLVVSGGRIDDGRLLGQGRMVVRSGVGVGWSDGRRHLEGDGD